MKYRENTERRILKAAKDNAQRSIKRDRANAERRMLTAAEKNAQRLTSNAQRPMKKIAHSFCVLFRRSDAGEENSDQLFGFFEDGNHASREAFRILQLNEAIA
jgi:hypothetical protein